MPYNTAMKGRNILGLLGGVVLMLSALAHSVMGWQALSAELAKAQAPEDLVLGLQIGWHFGGMAMVAFGLIAISVFRRALRGESPSMIPIFVMSIAYLLFGVYALFVSKFDPFAFIFIVPAALLGAAATGRRVT